MTSLPLPRQPNATGNRPCSAKLMRDQRQTVHPKGVHLKCTFGQCRRLRTEGDLDFLL